MVSTTRRRYDPHADRGIGALDLASAYLRVNGVGVLGRYLLATAPLYAAAWLWIDAVTAQDRPALAMVSGLLLVAMVWRWAGLAWVQAMVMRDAGMKVKLTPARVGGAVLVRLVGNVLMIWGGILILPALWGFYFGSFSPIMMLDPKARTGVAFKSAAKIVWSNLGSLWRLAVAKVALVIIALLSVLLVQVFLLQTILPSLLVIDTADLQLATRGPAWWLGLGFLMWALFDLFWAVASVFEFSRLQARRSGSDLRARLAWLEEAA